MALLDKLLAKVTPEEQGRTDVNCVLLQSLPMHSWQKAWQRNNLPKK